MLNSTDLAALQAAEATLAQAITQLQALAAEQPPVVTPPPPPPPPPPPVTGTPTPSATSTILLDMRQSLQQAADIDAAFALFGVVDHTPYRVDSGGGWAFSTNADGTGLHAYRADWGVATGDEGLRVIHYLPNQVPEFYAQWKGRLGAFPTDAAALGAANYYGFWPVTNANKRALFDRPSNQGRVDYTWQRSAPEGVEVEMGEFNYVYYGDSSLWNANSLGNAVYTTTVHVKAGSSPTSADGIAQVWINGLLVADLSNVPGGSEMFDRWSFPETSTQVPTPQSEYFYDILVWTP